MFLSLSPAAAKTTSSRSRSLSRIDDGQEEVVVIVEVGRVVVGGRRFVEVEFNGGRSALLIPPSRNTFFPPNLGVDFYFELLPAKSKGYGGKGATT